MSIIPLQINKKRYTCSAYLLIDENDLSGRYNTLVDIGSDDYIIEEILTITGNKYRQTVAQVILTHNHSDHCGGLNGIIERFQPKVYAYTSFPGVSHILHEGEIIRIGNDTYQVLFTPGHSDDSICLYSAKEGAVFCGDIPLKDVPPDSAYPKCFLTTFEKLCSLDVKTLYPGHGRPLLTDCKKLLYENLANIKSSRLY